MLYADSIEGALVKLQLIAPATQENLRKRAKPPCPPLGLAMVAALTPPEVEVSLTDENVTVIDFQKETDLVGITTQTITAQRAYEIADTYRRKGIPVILGGPHCTFYSEEALEHADAVAIGEGEKLVPKILEDLAQGKLKTTYKATASHNLKNLPFPH